MKRSLIVPLLAALAWGCQEVDRTTIYAARDTWRVVAPEYKNYVSGDAKLDEATKATRIRTAEMLTKLLEETPK
jgi:hypothetical protein